MIKQIAKKLSLQLIYFIKIIITNIPGRIGIFVRRILYSRLIIECGSGLKLGISITISGGTNVHLGENNSFMNYSSIHAHGNGLIKTGNNLSVNTNVCLGASEKGEIIIGNDVLIAQNVVLRASDHEHSKLNIPINKQGHKGGEISIGDNVWIGANSVIAKNTIIGSHSIIAAGTIIGNIKIPEFSIVVGNPGRVILKRQENA